MLKVFVTLQVQLFGHILYTQAAEVVQAAVKRAPVFFLLVEPEAFDESGFGKYPARIGYKFCDDIFVGRDGDHVAGAGDPDKDFVLFADETLPGADVKKFRMYAPSI